MKTKAKILAKDEFYELRFVGGRYKAGCRNFSRARALEHWTESQDQENFCYPDCPDCLNSAARGKKFVAAIKKFREPKKVAKKKVATKSK